VESSSAGFHGRGIVALDHRQHAAPGRGDDRGDRHDQEHAEDARHRAATGTSSTIAVEAERRP
jgi:hypothetical protein